MLASGVREAVVAAGKKHGFQYVTLDLGGYRTGSHNEVLVGRALRIVWRHTFTALGDSGMKYLHTMTSLHYNGGSG